MGYLDGKTLNDLTPATVESGKSNLLELTDAEKWQIVELLKEGKGFKHIKKNLRRKVGESNFGFSYGQIKSIENEWQSKIVELTPKEEL